MNYEPEDGDGEEDSEEMRWGLLGGLDKIEAAALDFGVRFLSFRCNKRDRDNQYCHV